MYAGRGTSISIALPKRLFGLPLRANTNSPIENMLPRATSYDFELRDAMLENSARGQMQSIAQAWKLARHRGQAARAPWAQSSTPAD